MKLLALILIFIGAIKTLSVIMNLNNDIKIEIQSDNPKEAANMIILFCACEAVIDIICGIMLFSLL